jgi:hypothetical protein
MMKKFEDFTKEERYNLAEFVYSWEQDVLIKPDALKCLVILKKHELIDSDELSVLTENVNLNIFGVSEEIIDILFTKIEEESGKLIMKEYYS